MLLLLAWSGSFVQAAATISLTAPDGVVEAAQHAGMPLLKNFSPQDYAGYPQNWAVVQDHRGIVYVGNGEAGVLEFDGSRWRHIDLPNLSSVRSLAVDASGRVYVGGVETLGYLAPDEQGSTKYVSLLDKLSPADRQFSDVWNICITGDGVYFQTKERLLRFAKGVFRSWVPAQSFHFAFAVHDQLYILQKGVGLQRLQHDQLETVPGGERFANERIYALLPWSADALLIGTRDHGWFIEEGGHYRPWLADHADALKAAQIYGALWLGHDRLAVATLQAGVLVFDRRGNEIDRIDTGSGLLGDTVYRMALDNEDGLWLALDNGIARVETGSVLTRFSPVNGLQGSVVLTHRHDGTLYAGTTKGLFKLVDTDKQPRFVRVPHVVGPVWGMLDMDDQLLVAAVGVFKVDVHGQAIRLSTEMAFAMVRPDATQDRLLVSQSDGLRAVHLRGDQLVPQGSVGGVVAESHALSMDSSRRLWVGLVDDGVALINLPGADQPLDKVPVRRLVSPVADSGVSKALTLGTIDGAVRLSGASGMQQFDERSGKLVPDERFAGLFGTQSRQIWTFEQDASGKVWMYTIDAAHHAKSVGVATADAQGRYHWDGGVLPALSGKTIFDIHADPDGVIWLAADDGLYRYDARSVREPTSPSRALVRKVTTHGGRVLWGGAGAPPSMILPWRENGLRFDYAHPDFAEAGENAFQVMLQGMDDDWSAWTAEGYRDYTNLPEGDYRFLVRARDAHGKLGGQAGFSFRILPPWYRTWWAYLILAVTLIVVITGVIGWRLSALRQRNRLLVQLVDERTQALAKANEALAELAVTDALTGLKNRRYLADHIGHDIARVKRHYRQLALDDNRGASAEINLLLLMMDIDHFKEVNDQYGHVAGDRVLAQVSTILQTAMRETDTAVRWGGEEFLIIARSASDSFGAVMAERIRSMVEQHVFDLGDGQSIRRTCSVGFALYPLFPTSPERYGWEDVVNVADQCMYEAKRAGRNRWTGVVPVESAIVSVETLPASPDLEALCADGYVRRLTGGGDPAAAVLAP